MSENTLNLDNLLQEFDLPMTEPTAPAPIPAVLPTEEEVKNEVDNLGSIEDITKTSIAQIKRTMNMTEQELKMGNITPKMLEAMSKLADSLTNAVQVLATQELTNVTFEQKEKAYNLRKWEIEERLRLKQEGKDAGPQVNVNAIVTDRESLLDAILQGINKNGNTPNRLSETTVALETSGEEEQSNFSE